MPKYDVMVTINGTGLDDDAVDLLDVGSLARLGWQGLRATEGHMVKLRLRGDAADRASAVSSAETAVRIWLDDSGTGIGFTTVRVTFLGVAKGPGGITSPEG